MAKRTLRPGGKQKINRLARRAKNVGKAAAPRADLNVTELSDRSVRHLAALAKAEGLAYKRRNLAHGKVTAYMRKRVKQLLPALTGEAEIIRGTRAEVQRVKKTKGLLGHGPDYVLAPKRPETVQHIREGMLEVVRPLSSGETIVGVQIPGGNGVENVLAWLESGDADKRKQRHEEFGFRINGYMSQGSFRNARELLQRLRSYETIRGRPEEALEIEIFRVYPPGDWYRLARAELKDRQAHWTGKMRGQKGAALRRIKRNLQKIERRIARNVAEAKEFRAGSGEGRHAEFLAKEKRRWDRRKEDINRARRAKRKGPK